MVIESQMRVPVACSREFRSHDQESSGHVINILINDSSCSTNNRNRFPCLLHARTHARTRAQTNTRQKVSVDWRKLLPTSDDTREYETHQLLYSCFSSCKLHSHVQSKNAIKEKKQNCTMTRQKTSTAFREVFLLTHSGISKWRRPCNVLWHFLHDFSANLSTTWHPLFNMHSVIFNREGSRYPALLSIRQRCPFLEHRGGSPPVISSPITVVSLLRI